MTLTSDTMILTKSVGINSWSAMWTDMDVEGDYERIDAPSDWRELIAEADDNTYGCTTPTECGEESDWEWYSYSELDRNGYQTGVVMIAAVYVG
jgi:hypothetical protein